MQANMFWIVAEDADGGERRSVVGKRIVPRELPPKVDIDFRMSKAKFRRSMQGWSIRLRLSIRRISCDRTFVLTSTKGCVQP